MILARSVALAAALLFTLCGATLADSYFGRFIGKFVADFSEDGRKVTLVEPFAFVDPFGKEWDVPTGYKTDGASVPAALWALYPPFTGKYRQAAVIHDYYCDKEERTWQDTHKVFYYAMRAANVDEKTAKIMYGAVYLFGPRWGPGTGPGQRSAPIKATAEEQERVVKQLQNVVEKDNPDLDGLVKEAKRVSAEALTAPRAPSE